MYGARGPSCFLIIVENGLVELPNPESDFVLVRVPLAYVKNRSLMVRTGSCNEKESFYDSARPIVGISRTETVETHQFFDNPNPWQPVDSVWILLAGADCHGTHLPKQCKACIDSM